MCSTILIYLYLSTRGIQKSTRERRDKSGIISEKIQRNNIMESVLLIILVGLAGGVAVGLQSPMASMISQRLGIFESVFIVHVGGALIALIPLLFMGGGKLAQWKD